MKYILITISFFCLQPNLNAQVADSIFINAHITKLTNAKTYTLQVAALMPEEKYTFKPVDDEMNFGNQLLHISENLCWLSSSYLSEIKNPITDKDRKSTSKEAIMQVVTKAYDFAISTLQKFDTKKLSDTVEFFAGPKNKLQIINLLEDHQTHHRGQLLVYLRLNNIKPPTYVGW